MIRDNIFYVTKNAWQDDKKIIFYIFIQAIAGCLSPLFGIYIPNIILQGVTGVIPLNRMIFYTSFIAVGMAFLSGALIYIDSTIDTLLINNRIFYLKQIYLKYMKTDYTNIESDEGQNAFQRSIGILFNDDCGAYGMLKTLGGLLGSIMGIVAYAGIVSMLSWIIVLALIVTSVAHFLILKKVTNYEIRQRDMLVPLDRKIDYILNKLSDYKYGKETRIFPVKTWLFETLEVLVKERGKWLIKIASYNYMVAIIDAVILILRDGIAYAYILSAILQSKIRIDEFVLYFSAISGFSTFIFSLIEQVIHIVKTSHEVGDIRTFLNMSDSNGHNNAGIVDKKIPETVTIEFQNVSFKYKNSDTYILQDLSFKIAAGEKIALVGENGAGKTTLIKLLCGLYKPTSGEILVNNVAIEDYSKEELYALFSVVFQDAFIIPMTLAQNISLTKEAFIDYKKVGKCLDQVGLSNYKAMTKKQLTKIMCADGIELSGGEMQKTLMARALYKEFAILVLDEPTAALDPISESEIYQKYSELSQNRTSIFISHRLASTHFCDKVLLLKNGKIVEAGTHDELLKRGGEYCNMYQHQSRYYVEEII